MERRRFSLASIISETRGTMRDYRFNFREGRIDRIVETGDFARGYQEVG